MKSVKTSSLLVAALTGSFLSATSAQAWYNGDNSNWYDDNTTYYTPYHTVDTTPANTYGYYYDGNSYYNGSRYSNDISVTLNPIYNGIRILYTTGDSGVVPTLQTYSYRDMFRYFGNAVTVSQYNVYNGVQIDVVGNHPRVVSQLQNLSPSVLKPKIYRMSPLSQFRSYESKMSTWQTNVSNGVKVSFTSSDGNVSRFLQSFDFNLIFSGMGSWLSITRTNVSGGVEVIVTSTDYSTIQRLQTTLPYIRKYPENNWNNWNNWNQHGPRCQNNWDGRCGNNGPRYEYRRQTDGTYQRVQMYW